MSNLEGLDRRLGLVKTSSWGTETVVTKLVEHTSFEPSEEVAQIQGIPQTARHQSAPCYGAVTSSVTISGRCTYDGAWIDILLSVAGANGASPTETTLGQGDYAHSYELASLKTRIYTLAWFLNGTTVITFGSVQFTSITLSAAVNEPMTYTATGIADYLRTGVANTSLVLNGLTRQNYEEITFGGSGGAFLVNDFGGVPTGISVTNFSYNLTRPGIVRDYYTNTASPGLSTATNAPRYTGRSEQSLTVTLADNSTASYNYHAKYATQNLVQGAKINMTGRQIGTGVNRSFSLNIPSMHWGGSYPGNLGIQEDTIAFPELTFTPIEGLTTPANYSNNNTYWTFVNLQSAAY